MFENEETKSKKSRKGKNYRPGDDFNSSEDSDREKNTYGKKRKMELDL